MRDTDLYRQLLGLTSPWTVERVELDVKTHRVDVFAVHEQPASWPCLECKKPCGLHDHDEEKVWRHLDSCGFGTYLHARVPRASCATHGVRQVRVPGAEPKARFTALFERFAIAVLLETSVAGGARAARHQLGRGAPAQGARRGPRAGPAAACGAPAHGHRREGDREGTTLRHDGL